MDKEEEVDTDIDDGNIAPLTENGSKSHEVKNKDVDHITAEGNQHDDEPLSSQWVILTQTSLLKYSFFFIKHIDPSSIANMVNICSYLID